MCVSANRGKGDGNAQEDRSGAALRAIEEGESDEEKRVPCRALAASLARASLRR
jgi:hypothetical protein